MYVGNSYVIGKEKPLLLYKDWLINDTSEKVTRKLFEINLINVILDESISVPNCVISLNGKILKSKLVDYYKKGC